jgi:hypothetical protein
MLEVEWKEGHEADTMRVLSIAPMYAKGHVYKQGYQDIMYTSVYRGRSLYLIEDGRVWAHPQFLNGKETCI